MEYKVKYDDKALKRIRKLDKSVQRLIKSWIENNLIGTSDPRRHGKALTGDLSGYWRYRVGDYRIVAEIVDNEVIIVIVDIGHRSSIYRQ